MVVVYLALGSNLGDRRQILSNTRDLIREQIGAIENCSKEYETEPVGFKSEHPFINQVIKVVTELSPEELLQCTQDIERKMGRVRKSDNLQYSDRSCDIDIIFYGDSIINQVNLQIPHPRFRERAFVLRPLLEIAANVIDPVTRKSVMELVKKQEE